MSKETSFDWLSVSQPSLLTLAARMQFETVALMTQRAHAYMAISDTLAMCQDSDDVMTEQVRFWQIAQLSYIESLNSIVGASPKNDNAKPVPSVPLTRDRNNIVIRNNGNREREAQFHKTA